MAERDAERGQVTATAAEVYEEFFVPALFGQWAEPVLDAARVGPGHRVLDVGCGTGVVARAARPRVGPTGAVTGVDVNDGMLAVARRADPEVLWRQGAAESLPFGDGSFDRVVCQFALMFLVDRAAALGEMARVLAPGGRVAIATWSSADRCPGYAAMIALLDRLFGASAADALRAPFSLGAPDELRALVGAAFPGVEVAEHQGVARFASVDAWVLTDVKGWTLADMIDDDQLALLLAEARTELREFVLADGSVSFPALALIASAGTG